MKTWLAALVVVFGASLVWADVGPKPAPAPDKSVPIVIETFDGKVGPAKLIIPKKLLDKSRAALDLGDGTAVAEHKSRLPMMLAGIFLTLSIAFAGLWLVRQRGTLGTRTVALLLGGILFLAIGGAVLLANSPPGPLVARPVQPVGAIQDRVLIEITDNGDTIKLLVHKSKLTANAPRPIPLPAPVPQPAPVPRPGGAATGGAAVPGVAPGAPAEQPVPKPLIKE
jgi:hypothetical protein